ncbi:MAG TPA: hypothetical protein VEC38_06615 [Candidatus Binataceae bacterium]|nr:hypothetical protein [Candidatus Binataceae bacterium]
MKLADIYRDWRVAGGVALILLGAGNWVIGLDRTEQYSQMAAAPSHPESATDYRSFDEIDPGKGGAVLEPLTTQQRELSYATARMDFYHATFLTGQTLTIVGLFVTLWGFIALIQSDTRKTLRRITGGAGARAPAGGPPPAS